jgi:hypothetical protein
MNGSKTAALTAAKWIGTGAGVSGAMSTVGWVQRETSLVVLQATFTIIDVIGIYRWLGT